MGSVDDYLDRMAKHDWEGLGRTLTRGPFERVGPFRDVLTDTAAYVEFLGTVIPSLSGYRFENRRITAVERRVFAEVAEHFEVDGVMTEFPEVLVFELDDEELINHVSVYIMRPGDQPPVEGGSAV
jgi:hypothetical protein